MFSSTILVFLSLFTVWSFHASAALTPGARYFAGQVKVHLSQPTVCYVEALYSPDLSGAVFRSVSTLPHLSAAGQPVWITVGPYAAQFLPARSLYRYQDAAPGAKVKDLVVNVAGPATPVKFGILYWHAEAGHHDPVVCDGLRELSQAAELKAVEEAFARFENPAP